MAVVVRRTWATLKTEFIERARRGTDDAAFATRAEQWIVSATFDLGHLFNHRELQATDTTKVCVVGSAKLDADVTTGTNIIETIELQDTAGVFLKMLNRRSFDSIIAQQSTKQATPSFFSTWGERVYINTLADLAYKTIIYYTKLVTAPDFVSGSPEFNRVWDDRILEWALMLCGISLGNQELFISNKSLVEGFLQVSPEMAVKAAELTRPRKDEMDTGTIP